MTLRLESGTPAPDFTLTTQNGTPVTLSALRGGPVVLYFYPAAMTPACTAQACDFRDSFAPLQAAGYTVLGVSPDDVTKLERFHERDHLPFDLLADPDHAVMDLYGTWGEKKNYGRTYEGVIRSTFIIDADGIIRDALYNVRATGHVARIMRILGLAD